MKSETRARLERECAVFAHHLCGRAAPGYAVAQYVRAHELGVVTPRGGETRFDRLLVACAREGPGLARWADAYAALLARGGLLRRKLVLLLSILESHGESAELVDHPTPGPAPVVLLRALWTAGVFAALFCLAALVLTPLRAACALAGAPREPA